ncbi:MAG: methylmalonyl Co-A mutase-associated GTPase MeaB, partial [Acidimicrobiia bacterium]|nr:methylmalonyl Co-A mutase-associated GTPase MeaB [Acidimicrobiia bacterium]
MVDRSEQFVAASQGNRRALARLISFVEDHPHEASSLLAEIFPYTGRAFVIGMTGAPGAGKSTLTDQLIGLIRADGHEVAVLAIDPSSPFTGGA